MAESVLSQNKTKKETAPKEAGEQSVLGSASSGKQFTFYKKAWFWITVSLVILAGVGTLVFFLVLNANLAAEEEKAIESYNKNSKAAYSARSSFDSKFYLIYSEAGLSGYYGDNKSRADKLRNKCLEKFDISSDLYKEIGDIETYYGDTAVDMYGSSKTSELSKKYGEAAEKLEKAKKNITKCKSIVNNAIKDDVSVKFGEFQIIKKTYWDDSVVKATVTNKSDESHSFSITVAAVDEDGEEISTDSIYTKTLGAGESATFDVFDYVSSTKYDKMKKAKFIVKKVYEY